MPSHLLRFLLAAIVIAGAERALTAAEAGAESADDGAALSLTLDTPRIDDTARLLKITNRSGAFQLRAARASLELDLDFYKSGKKVEDRGLSIAVRSGKPADRGKFSVQLADLDYLRLGDGPAAHLRAYAAVEFGGATASYTKDVPKDVFDVSEITGTQTFGPEHSTSTEVPLFWIVARTGQIRGRKLSPAEVIRAHAEGDVLIAVLKLQ